MAMLLMGVAAAAAILAVWLVTTPSAPGRVTSTPVVSPGESDEGQPLAALHPLQVMASAASAALAGAVPTNVVAAAPNPPLTLRQGCAWGKPGSNPYRGSTEQALTQAHLPPEVVRQIVANRAAGAVTDRVEISTKGIRTVQFGREFNAKSFAMTFGNTLCLNSRVNFAPGHVERADLYEALDARGRKYAVMVPDVCGNVSVLGARGEHGMVAGMVGELIDRGAPLEALARALGDHSEAPWVSTLNAPADRFTVPEPGTLACVLAALAAMLWLGRRKRR